MLAAQGSSLLSTALWEVAPLLSTVQNSVSSSSSRGYVLTRSAPSALRAAVPAAAGGALAVAPLASAVNITLLLPIGPTSANTTISELKSLPQFFQDLFNTVGTIISGISAVFSLLVSQCFMRHSKKFRKSVENSGEPHGFVCKGRWICRPGCPSREKAASGGGGSSGSLKAQAAAATGRSSSSGQPKTQDALTVRMPSSTQSDTPPLEDSPGAPHLPPAPLDPGRLDKNPTFDVDLIQS